MSDQSISVGRKAQIEEQTNGSAMDSVWAIANIFIDPAASVRHLQGKSAWVLPLAVLLGLIFLGSILNAPFTRELVQSKILAQGQTQDPEQALAMADRFSKIGLFVGPVVGLAMVALISWLITAIAAVMGKTAPFRKVFPLAICCSIITALQYIAGYVVLRSKGEHIDNPEQLRPAFGLDLLFSDLHGAALAFVGYFSIFQIWYLIAFTLGMAALTRSSKGQAFLMITPAWILPLALTVFGAMMQR